MAGSRFPCSNATKGATGTRCGEPGRGSVRAWPAAQRTPDRWRLEFAALTLGLSRTFDAVAVAGRGCLADEGDLLRRARGLLDAEGLDDVPIWLVRTAPHEAGAVGTGARRRSSCSGASRARALARDGPTRWARRAGAGRGVARARRGLRPRAPTLVGARVAGARRVGLGGGDGTPFVFLEPEGEDAWRRRPLFALRQAAHHLGDAEEVEAVPAGGALVARFREPGRRHLGGRARSRRGLGGDPREDPCGGRSCCGSRPARTSWSPSRPTTTGCPSDA